MKILVAVKRVVDYKAVVRIKSDGSGVDTTNVKMSMNPFDEIAVEEAVRLKEKKLATEIIALSIGGDACQETLRTALAMGADRAVLVKTTHDVDPLLAAKIMQAIAKEEKPELIILGKQAIDTDNNQTGQMLAALMQCAQGTFVSKLDFRQGGVSATREIDGGLETVFLNLPAVVTTDLRLNEPRYISLPNIVAAKRKPLNVIEFASLNIPDQTQVVTLKVAMPDKRRAGVKLATVADLVERLKNEAHVLG